MVISHKTSVELVLRPISLSARSMIARWFVQRTTEHRDLYRFGLPECVIPCVMFSILMELIWVWSYRMECSVKLRGVRNPIVGVPILSYIDDRIRIYMPTPISTIHISSLFRSTDDVACMSILFWLTSDVNLHGFIGKCCYDVLVLYEIFLLSLDMS